MIADFLQQDALAGGCGKMPGGLSHRGIGPGRLPRPEASGDKGSQQRQRERTGRDPAGPGEQPPKTHRAGFGWTDDLRTQLPPNFGAVTFRAFRSRERVHGRQNPMERPEVRPAEFAGFEVLRQVGAAGRLAVVVEDELFLAQVVHSVAFTTGSSARRIFCTARKMLCLVALGPVLSTRPMASIDSPSKCRSTNAVRSIGVSCSIAASTFCRTSK